MFWRLVQDGGVGHVLTLSSESTRIITDCSTIRQEDTGTHQKRYPTSKDKGEATIRR